MSKQSAKPAEPVPNDVDAWMRAEEKKPQRGRCYGCSHPDREAIDSAALHFIKRRNEGATTLPWGSFFAKYIKARFPSFENTPQSLRGHMERCRGAKLK